MTLQYRSEIDGLRAIAVIPVILFHAGITAFSGGFIGVDIFFVISGYLITSIILKEQSLGSFSLTNFYTRRARRILPALWFVTAITIPFSWLWMLPDDLTSFAGSVLSIPYFISNIFFWSEVGYFNSNAELKPLLHTWSLAVEEQYYLLFPAFLIISKNLGKQKQLCSLFAIAILSLLLSEWGWRNAESANFYLAPTRAWEILVGSMLAYTAFKSSIYKANIVSITGFLLIIFSVLFFDENTPTPSFYSLIPVMGTALVIYGAVKGTVLNKLLSYKPLVFIGLISYSLYLFHQPILAFWRIRTQQELGSYEIPIFLVATALFATTSWKFIEVPFRRSDLFSSKKLLILMGIVTVVFTLFGLYTTTQNGVPSRLSKSINELGQQNAWSEHCLFQVSDGDPKSMSISECGYNQKEESSYAIWGDSIAAALSPSLADSLLRHGASLTQLTHGHCAPIFYLERAHHHWSSNCIEFNQVAYELFLNKGIDTVILAANWSDFFNSNAVYFKEELVTDQEEMIELFTAQLNVTIEILIAEDINVVVLYPLIQSSKNVLHYVQQSKVFDNSWPAVSEPLSAFFETSQVSYQILDSIHSPVTRVYPEKVMCEKGACDLAPNGKILIADQIHPTPYGASLLTEHIRRSLK